MLQRAKFQVTPHLEALDARAPDRSQGASIRTNRSRGIHAGGRAAVGTYLAPLVSGQVREMSIRRVGHCEEKWEMTLAC